MAYKARWELIYEEEKRKLRATLVERKFLQLCALMASAEGIGWTEALGEEVSDVRERWIRLKTILAQQGKMD